MGRRAKDETAEAAASELSGWRGWAGALGGILLGGVLLVAAWAKALDPGAFARQIEQEGLAFLLPALAVALIALALEVGLGAALVLGIRRAWVMWPTAALVAFFLFLTGRAYWRFMNGEVSDEPGCGCFGNLVQRTPAEAFWQDVLLMVPALLLAFVGFQTAGRWPRKRLALVALLTLGVVVFAWKAPDLPLDNLATRLKPGVKALDLCVGSQEDGNEACLGLIVPEMRDGEHWLLMTELEDESFLGAIERFNEYHWGQTEVPLWVLSAASEEDLFAFRWEKAPAFEVREAPAPLLRTLYRTLPRSFRVLDGEVVETVSGLPPVGDPAG